MLVIQACVKLSVVYLSRLFLCPQRLIVTSQSQPRVVHALAYKVISFRHFYRFTRLGIFFGAWPLLLRLSSDSTVADVSHVSQRNLYGCARGFKPVLPSAVALKRWSPQFDVQTSLGCCCDGSSRHRCRRFLFLSLYSCNTDVSRRFLLFIATPQSTQLLQPTFVSCWERQQVFCN